MIATHALALLLAAAQHEGHEELGTVRFETSCGEAAQPEFERAVALLHSFEYKRAIEGFEASLAKDPDCAMAYWGIALSVWSNPFAAGTKAGPLLQRGRQLLEKARAAPHRTPREDAYLGRYASPGTCLLKVRSSPPAVPAS
jgi:hypothetical protein